MPRYDLDRERALRSAATGVVILGCLVSGASLLLSLLTALAIGTQHGYPHPAVGRVRLVQVSWP